jgi:hypothetical protein
MTSQSVSDSTRPEPRRLSLWRHANDEQTLASTTGKEAEGSPSRTLPTNLSQGNPPSATEREELKKLIKKWRMIRDTPGRPWDEKITWKSGRQLLGNPDTCSRSFGIPPLAARAEILNALRRHHHDLADEKDLLVKPFREGYEEVLCYVEFPKRVKPRLLFLVRWPMEPWYQTQSQVATMMFVSIPNSRSDSLCRCSFTQMATS